MVDHLLPDELEQFLQRQIDSITQLEALLLLRNESHTAWATQSVAKRLYVGEGETADALNRLSAQGLLSHNNGLYKFDPQTDDLRQGVALLADYYRRHLIPITNLIHAKPRRIQQFADAFKIKKED